ncbi:MAG TPA: hypothetical protein VKV77_13335 [Methylovirgula sp.]|nr:hypothetical protein [Methylovirgula sp.]
MASFVTFFHGRLTGFEATCIQSFLDHGHDVTIFAYEDCGAPSHFRIFDAARILKREHLFFYNSDPGRGSVSGFSNRFRYKLLELADGWWIDTDVVCLSREWPASGKAAIGAAWEDTNLVGSAVLRLDSAMAKELAERAAAIGKKAKWGETGPQLLTGFVRDKRWSNSILPAPAFYPVHYLDWYKIFMSNFRECVQQSCGSSYALHLWNEMARRTGFDKSILPDRNSFFGSLVARHGTERFFKDAPKFPETRGGSPPISSSI